MHNVAVIGCGAIGLTSALAIQERLKNVKVTIFTKDVSPNTTSDIAAGLWEPYLVENTPPDKVNEWSRATFDYILSLWKKGKAKEAGIILQPVINLSNMKNYTVPDWVNITMGYSELSREYLVNLSRRYNKTFTGGFSFVSFTWEASHFLPFLQQEFLRNGGEIVMREINNFEELREYDVIVNCTGIKSRELADDTSVRPVRGQISRAVAPWLCHTYIVDADNDVGYIIPNINSVILGGTKQNDYNLNVDEKDKHDIFRKCASLVPALASVKIIKHQVGLRPGRDKVRLEIDIKGDRRNGLRVVHNYGHGGAGITLSIGCAREAAKLVEEILSNERIDKCKL